MRRALAAAVLVTLGLAGCGDTGSAEQTAEESASSTPSATESSSAPSSETATPAPGDPSATEEQADEAIAIRIHADEVRPNGKRVEVAAGEPVRLRIDADRAGELHVHSSPEQELPFRKGTSTVELTIDRPGLVDVEEHESGSVILQLEVR